MIATKYTVPMDIQNRGPDCVERFCQMVQAGQSPRLAEMLALQEPPRCMTDAVYFDGLPKLGDQFRHDPVMLRSRLKELKQKYNFTPSSDSHYDYSLARFPNDPEAYVGPTDGISYIKKTVERRGWASEGVVTAQAREPESDPHAVRVDNSTKKQKKRNKGNGSQN